MLTSFLEIYLRNTKSKLVIHIKCIFYLKIYKCNCLCIQIRTETRLDEKVCLNWSMNLTILHARNNAEVWMRWELLIWAIYQKTFFTAYKNVNVIWQLYFATILLLKRIKWIVLYSLRNSWKCLIDLFYFYCLTKIFNRYFSTICIFHLVK